MGMIQVSSPSFVNLGARMSLNSSLGLATTSVTTISTATADCRSGSDFTTLDETRQQEFQSFQAIGDVLESGSLPCHVGSLCGIHAGNTVSRTIDAGHSTVTANLSAMTASAGPCHQLEILR